MKYNLVGIDGNAYSIMGKVISWMKKNDFTEEQIDEYLKKAESGDYDNLVRESVLMVDKINKRLEEGEEK